MVSIIVPCYNSEDFIDRCLESILAQKYKNIDLILVNDGSTDATSAIIQSWIPEFRRTISRILYLEQENEGVGSAVKHGFQKAVGDYLILLDSDDVLLPDAVLEMRRWLDENPAFGFVRSNGYYVSEGDIECTDRLLEVNEDMKEKKDIFEDLFSGTTYVWPGTYMIRMSLLDEIYPDREIYPSRFGQNLQFVMMAAYYSKAGFVDLPLMKYVVRENSLSHFSSEDAFEKELQALSGYRDIREYLIKHFLTGDEQYRWYEKLDFIYAKAYLNLAEKYKNKKLARESFQNLKELYGGGIPDLNSRLTYYKLMNPAYYCWLRILRKLGFER